MQHDFASVRELRSPLFIETPAEYVRDRIALVGSDAGVELRFAIKARLARLAEDERMARYFGWGVTDWDPARAAERDR